MTAADAYLEARPQLRRDVVLGPAVRKGAGFVHHVKDPRSGRYFQVGSREHFLMSRLDGTVTLAELGDDYAAAFHRVLDQRNWTQLLTMLAARGLLAVPPGTDAAPADPSPAPPARRHTLLYARLRLVDPERFFRRVERPLSFLFSAYFVVPALVVVAAVEVAVVLAAPGLFAESRRLWSTPAAGVAVVAVLWFSIVLHESAHALTATHYGGSATEIGLMWRFPVLAPYCQVNDVLLFQRRRHRVYTALAGVFASLLLLVPVLPVWLLTPPDSAVHHASAALLLFGSLAAASNFVPFLQLDGHAMLSHALGMQNLRVDSYAYLLQSARRRIHRQGTDTAYPRRVRLTYALYGAASLLFGAALTGWFCYSWYVQLQPRLGTAGTFAVLCTLFAVAAAVIIVTLRRRSVETR